jgi:hypothetical protein
MFTAGAFWDAIRRCRYAGRSTVAVVPDATSNLA